MSQATEYAAQLVDELRAADVKATNDPRAVNLPGVLVVPVPSRTYDLLAGYTASWTVVLLAPGVGDLSDAKALEDLADAVVTVLPQITTVEAASYVLPNMPDPKPAYLCRFDTAITED